MKSDRYPGVVQNQNVGFYKKNKINNFAKGLVRIFLIFVTNAEKADTHTNKNIKPAMRTTACSNEIPISSGSFLGRSGGPHSKQKIDFSNFFAPQTEQKEVGLDSSEYSRPKLI